MRGACWMVPLMAVLSRFECMVKQLFIIDWGLFFYAIIVRPVHRQSVDGERITE